MNDSDKEEYYFFYSATLRIWGKIPDFGEISENLGVNPTKTYRRGKNRPSASVPRFNHDMWQYAPQIDKKLPLNIHIQGLMELIRAKKAYLKNLRKILNVDVFCGYRSNCETGGFEVSNKSLELFIELEIPLGVSIIIC